MKRNHSPELLASFASGVIFAAGLALSGMTQPGKVTSFLDFTGFWDPTLAFVMAGAIAVYAYGYRAILERKKPRFADSFQVPKAKPVDRRLLIGASLFGIGWGLSGFCPGPAFTSLVSFKFEPILFVAAMSLGMVLFQQMERRKSR